MGAIIGGGLFLLMLGFFVVEVCFPVQWRTRNIWLLTSLVGIPAGLVVLTLVLAWPPLLVLGLIVAFAGGSTGKKRS